MFSSGNITVYVSNMDTAVRFYTETLGLKLAYRFGDHGASVEVGKGLTIGLHPAISGSTQLDPCEQRRRPVPARLIRSCKAGRAQPSHSLESTVQVVDSKCRVGLHPAADLQSAWS